ncbi:sulfatase-like hydrolase/transferase, partial [bacterium]|nr:sulfatase-like hydrolase/transferase [bacterium]
MKLSTRRQFIGQASGLLAANYFNQAFTAGEANQRPNILVILVDDLGFGDLNSYGSDDLLTPNMDSIGANGVRFLNAYSNCPVCSPTRAALLSGRFQDLVGVPGVIRTHENDSWGYLSPDAKLLPEILQKNGYQTACIGKWHLGLEPPNLPNLRGFDFFKGFLGDMMDDYNTHRRHGINYMRENNNEIDPKGHATDLFSDWAVDYINHQTPEKPFFLYLAYNAPHTPIQPLQEYVDRYRKRNPNADEKRAQIAGLIEHLDDGVGR